MKRWREKLPPILEPANPPDSFTIEEARRAVREVIEEDRRAVEARLARWRARRETAAREPSAYVGYGERMSSPPAVSTADTTSCEDAFMRAHGLDPAVREAERLGREFFGAAYRRTECSVRMDGDFGTEYLLVSVLIDSDVSTMLDAEPGFLGALADRVRNVDWSTTLVSLRVAPDTD